MYDIISIGGWGIQTPNSSAGVKFDTIFSVPLFLSILYMYTTYLHEKI